MAIAFDGDYSQPTVSFTVGGSGSFTASADILWSTNGTDWVFGTTLNGLVPGDTPSYALPPSGTYPKGFIATTVAVYVPGVA